MRFILENPAPPSEILFSDVETNQFFVSTRGYLCQKVTNSSFNIVADEKGNPLASYTQTNYEKLGISRILPKVVKIEF